MVTNQYIGKLAVESPARNFGKSLLQENGVATDRAYQTTEDIFHLCNVLTTLSSEFRRLFGHILNSTELNQLDAHEREVFEQNWPLWYYYANHPRDVFSQPLSQARHRISIAKSELEENIRTGLKAGLSESAHASLVSTDLSWGDKPTLWVRLDLHDPIEYYISAEKVVAALGTALKSATDPNLTRYLIEKYWHRVAFIPLIRGKLINRAGWNLPTESVMNGVSPDSAWMYVLQEIPTAAYQTLELSEWDNEDVVLANTLSACVGDMSILGSQLADLVRTPSIEDVAVQSAQRSIDYKIGLFNRCLQLALDTMKAIQAKVNGQDISNLTQRRPYRDESIRTINGLYDLILPFKGFDGVHPIKMSDLPEYSQRLQNAVPQANYVRLNWIRDALDNL